MDYAKFSLSRRNRTVTEQKLSRLTKAIKKKDLTVDCPIAVDRNFVILRGQHRFLACKNLGLPVHYFMTERITDEDVPSMECEQDKWTGYDFMKRYIEDGKKDYKKLQEFMDTFGFHLMDSIFLLNGNLSADVYNQFRRGDFKIKDYDTACNIAKAVVDFKPYFVGYKERHFIKAYAAIYKLPDFDHRYMLQKMKYLSHRMHKCVNRRDYLQMLEEIYNYHNTKRRIYFIARVESIELQEGKAA
jgi:hypothetical protein